MTDYAVRRGNVGKVSKKSSWKLVVIIFLSSIFLLAVYNGLVRVGKLANRPVGMWDGVSSFVVAVSGEEDYIAIFQKDPKRLVAFKLGDLFGRDAEGTGMLKTLSQESGVVIKNYLVGGGDEIVEQFEDFKSYATPVKIVFGQYDSMQTNIARFDALRLWWQAKSVRSNDMDVVDISDNFNGNVAQKVMGTNSVILGRYIGPYVENGKILSDDLEIQIVNRTGDFSAAGVLESFISTLGGRVTAIVGSTEELEKCLVVGRKTYTRDYLAKTFACDIKDLAFGDQDGEILTIAVGQEFKKSYL